MYQSDIGVILFSTSYGDSDKIFKVFTKLDGVVPVLGKGVKKITSKRSVNLDTLNVIKASFYKKNDFYYVNDTSLIKNYSQIRSSLVVSSWVFYIFEVINSILVEGEAESLLFNQLIKTLDKLNTSPNKRVVYKYLQLLVKKQGFWDSNDYILHPYLKLIESSDSVSLKDQLYIDNFFNSKLEEVSDKKLNSILLIKSLN